MILRFIVPGQPIPQDRPRFTGRRAYDTKRCIQAKRDIGIYALEARVAKGLSGPSKSPMAIRIRFVGLDPRADVSNAVKLVEDGLNGVIWDDDRQVWHLEAERLQVGEGKLPSTTVEIEFN
jgi:Holliday junction resolvase RusA-like endonuclease